MSCSQLTSLEIILDLFILGVQGLILYVVVARHHLGTDLISLILLSLHAASIFQLLLCEQRIPASREMSIQALCSTPHSTDEKVNVWSFSAWFIFPVSASATGGRIGLQAIFAEIRSGLTGLNCSPICRKQTERSICSEIIRSSVVVSCALLFYKRDQGIKKI